MLKKTLIKNKGITLIALVVTIIVLLILAGITISMLTGDNSIIGKGKEASFKTDVSTFQEELILSISDDYLQKEGKRNAEDKFNKRGYDEIKTIIPSFTRKYQDKIEVVNDELVYIGLDEKERQWIEEAKIINAPKLTINYLDEAGNKLIEPYIITVPTKKYSIKSPEIEGYRTVDVLLEGEILEDKEINVEYYPQYYDLVFKGLNEKGEITNNETEIVSYMVGDGTDTAGNGVGNFSGKKLVIPDTYKGKTVTKIGKFAFRGNNTLETLILPSTIESVNDRCFQICLKLKEVYIPSGIIGGLSFYGCNNLNKIILGKDVTEIQASAFFGCENMEDFIIRSEKIELSGYGNFRGCSKLKEIKINQDNKSYKVIDGVMYTIDEKKIMIYPTGKEEENYVVPDTVEEIGKCAFSYAKNLKKIQIPTTVNSIKSRAFEGCSSLEEAYIGAETIDGQSFYACNNLKKVVLSNLITNLDNVCFSNCSNLNEFIIESTEFSINGYRNFDGCSSLKQIKIGENNKNYKVIDGVLYSKDTTKIILYPTGKDGEEYIIPDNVQEIGYAAFDAADNITKVKIQSSVNLVEGRAFENCKNLQKVEVDSKIIKAQAFYNCKELKEVKIGNTVTKFSSSIFGMCSSLTKITYDGKMEDWNNIKKDENWKKGNDNLSQVECIDGIINL